MESIPKVTFLVTGCAGFIGSHVSHRLLEAGHTVVGLDAMNAAYDRRLKDWRLARLHTRSGFEFHELDLAHTKAVEQLFATHRFDAVFNLGARAGVRQSVADPWEYLRTNAEGATTVLEMARRHDVRKVVLASTSSLYGKNNPRPYVEEANTDRPLSPYAASKKAAEAMWASYAHLYGLDAPVLRYFTVYGPAGRPDMSIFRFVRWISEGTTLHLHGDGAQLRDFTYVDDIARGTIAALKVHGFEIVNLGGDRPVALTEVIATLERHIGRPASIEHGARHPADVDATWADIGKASRLLGWRPETSLDEGLAKCVAWYQENREWAKNLDLGAI